jgi:SHS2 domain-containing protein
LDFDGDLYGATLGLSFIRRLRGERRFDDIAALVAQIRSDAEAARGILADPPDQAGSWKLEAGSRAPGGSETRRDERFWTELPHTADLAIRVSGASQRQLFARTAAAMNLLQGADSTRPITLARAVQVEAGDPADLLVAWLNRLLAGQDLDGEMYTRFELQELSATGLRGLAYGYEGTPSRAAIKAATYYDLSVMETVKGWEARVTFDV